MDSQAIKHFLKDREIEQRPEYVAKLASYIQDKEPLIYLFIINTDFIKADDILDRENYSAGVLIYNNRIKFLYNEKAIRKLSIEEFYFVIIHEAFHIFKKHTDVYSDMMKENHILANIATDTIINEEIIRTAVSCNGLKPKFVQGGCRFDEEFLDSVRGQSRDTITSKKVFQWYKHKKTPKSNLLTQGSYVKIKGEDSFGKITHRSKDRNIIERMTKKEMFEDAQHRNVSTNDFVKKTDDEVIPVLFGGGESNAGEIDENIDDYDVIVAATGNATIHDNESESGENSLFNAKTFTEKLFNEARELEEHFSIRTAGNGNAAFTKMLEQIMQPKVNWGKELRKNINLFHSRNKMKKKEELSFITYPWNPKSRYGILCKHTIEKESELSSNVIVAIDTSGSIFSSSYDLETFFTEIDALAKWLQFSKNGDVFTIQWDSEIKEGLRRYKKNDWKKFSRGERNILGGGGTMPGVIFSYLEETFKEYKNGYFIHENDIQFFIPDKKKLPYLIILTDGFFFQKISDDVLRLYKNNKKNILFFAKQRNDIPNTIRTIEYGEL